MMLSAEIAALRRIGPAPDVYGRRIAYAFGYDGDELQARTAAHYDFEIKRTGAELACVIDIYCALKHGADAFDDFDVDAREAAMIELRGPLTRASYRALQSSARAVLKGYRVVLPDGAAIHEPALYALRRAVRS